MLPRIEPVVASGRGAVARADTAGGTRPAESAAEIEMESLRPYREGTPASRIHWPTVARSGTLMERRLLADSDSRPLVVLDAGGPPDLHALDAAVRAAASLCVHLARLGGCSLLLPGDRRPTDLEQDLAAWPPLHIRLALVGPEDGSPTARMHARRGAIFWVTARPLTQRPRALDRIQADCHLVTPGLAGARAAFTVAGCFGGPARAGAEEGRMTRRVIEIGVFAALAWFAAAHWAYGLVADAPGREGVRLRRDRRGGRRRRLAGGPRAHPVGNGHAARRRGVRPRRRVRRDRPRAAAARARALGRARGRPRPRLRRPRLRRMALRRNRAVDVAGAAARDPARPRRRRGARRVADPRRCDRLRSSCSSRCTAWP